MAEEFEVSGETVLLMRIRFMDLLKKKWSWWFFVSFFIYFVYLPFFPLLILPFVVENCYEYANVD